VTRPILLWFRLRQSSGLSSANYWAFLPLAEFRLCRLAGASNRSRRHPDMLSWLGKGKKIEDILMGVHESISARSIGLLRRVGITEGVSFSGGVAKNLGMVHVLNEHMGLEMNVSDESHYMGALGAALFAMDRAKTAEVAA